MIVFKYEFEYDMNLNMRRIYLFIFYFIIFFILQINCNAQQVYQFNSFFNGYGFFSNPAFYAFSDNLFSFSFKYYSEDFNLLSINILNSLLISFYLPNTFDNSFFIGIPFNFKIQNFPISFGLMLSNMYASIGYYARVFGFIEIGLLVYFPYKDQYKEIFENKFEMLLGFKISKMIIISSNLFFKHSIFSNNINQENLFDYLNWKINFIIDIDYTKLFSISYLSENILELYFCFYEKYNSFNLSFSLDTENNTYSFGFNISNNRKYHENKTKGNLYIIDFNETKPNIDLFLKLREKSRIKGNVFLFYFGDRIKRITDYEDLIEIINELKKNNLCIAFIEKPDILNIAIATSFNYAIFDKIKSLDFSKRIIEKGIIEDITAFLSNFLTFSNIGDTQRERIIKNLEKTLFNNDNFKNIVQQIFDYFINIIIENINIDRDLLISLSLKENIDDLKDLTEYGLIDLFATKVDIIKKVEELSSKNNYSIKNKEYLFFESVKIYKEEWAVDRKIAIIYLNGIILPESYENSDLNLEIISYQKIEKIVKKIENERYVCALFLFECSGGDLFEGINILNLIKNLGEKLPVFILQGSLISSGSFIASLTKNKLYAHKNSIILPEFFIRYFSFAQIVNSGFYQYQIKLDEDNSILFFDEDSNAKIIMEDLIKSSKKLINSIIQKQRNLNKKQIDSINEYSIFSGFDSVGFNLLDFVMNFNSILNAIIRQLELDEENIKYEIIELSTKKGKANFFSFFSDLLRQILDYFA